MTDAIANFAINPTAGGPRSPRSLGPPQVNGSVDDEDAHESSPWHQKVAPAQPTAVMKLSAPRASAPPKATPNSRRAPDPCSVKANTRPVTITATVMSTWATVPLRLVRIVLSGPSQGIGGPVGAASAMEPTVSRRRTLQQTGRIIRRRWSCMLDLHGCSLDRLQNVTASRRVVRAHPRQLSHAAPFGCANDECHQVHGLGDEAWLRRHARLLNEAIEAEQSRRGAVGVDGGDPARVPRVPGLEKSQGFP